MQFGSSSHVYRACINKHACTAENLDVWSSGQWVTFGSGAGGAQQSTARKAPAAQESTLVEAPPKRRGRPRKRKARTSAAPEQLQGEYTEEEYRAHMNNRAASMQRLGMLFIEDSMVGHSRSVSHWQNRTISSHSTLSQLYT